MQARFSGVSITHIILLHILTGAGLMMWDHRFITDDAYISFTYARNMAEGHGLVWYPGSAEYGYTSFLFTLLVGLLIKLGIAVPAAAYLISVPAALAGLWLVYRIGKESTGAPLAGFLAMAAMASNVTYAAYATSGLETALALCFVLATYEALTRWFNSRQDFILWQVGAWTALALLTRLDSALLLMPVYGMCMYVLLAEYCKRSAGLSHLLYALLKIGAPPLLCVAMMIGFALAQYGQPLPNSFYVKMQGNNIMYGLQYLHTFLKAQHYMPVWLFVLWFALAGRDDFDWQRWNMRLAWLGAVLLWLSYMLAAGGDYMEFRFILPMLPFFYLLMFDLIIGAQARRTFLPVVVASSLVIVGNLLQPGYFYYNPMDKNHLESTRNLDRWLTRPDRNWMQVGKKLHEYFYTGAADDVHIAVTAAGAVPYFAQLPTTDVHGLNSRKVLEHARQYIDKPGHRLKAKNAYLMDAGVNLIIDHPMYVLATQNGSKLTYKCLDAHYLRTHNGLWDIPLVIITLHDDLFLLAHYLTPHPRIEALIKTGDIHYLAPLLAHVECGSILKRILEKSAKSP